MKNLSYYKKIILAFSLFLVIPALCIGVINFIVMKNKLMANTEKEINFEINRQLEIIQPLFTDIHTIQRQFTLDKKYSRYYKKNDFSAKNDIVTDLSEKISIYSNFDQIFFYDLADKAVYSFDGIYSEETFFSKIINTENEFSDGKLKNDDITYEKVELKGEENFSTAFFVPIFFAEENDVSTSGYVILLLNDVTLRTMLKTYSTNDDKVWVLSIDEQPLYASSKKYNDMIYSKTFSFDEFDSKSNYISSVVGEDNLNILCAVNKYDFYSEILSIAITQSIVVAIMIILGLIILFYITKKMYKPIKELVKIASSKNENDMIDEFDYLSYYIQDLISFNDLFKFRHKEITIEKAFHQLLNYEMVKNDKLYNYLINVGIEVNRKFFLFIILEDVIENKNIYEFLLYDIFDFSSNTYSFVHYTLDTPNNRYICFIATDEEKELINNVLDNKMENKEIAYMGDWVEDVKDIKDAYLKTKNLMGYKKIDKEQPIILCEIQDTSIVKAKNKKLVHILEYVEENFLSPDFTIKKLSMDFGTTSSNISHFFKKNTGQNISVYIEMKKMEKAKELLLTKKYKVNEVANALGYTSTNSLIELFKKYEGVTPKSFLETQL